LRKPIRGHLRHHARFYLAGILGLVVWTVGARLPSSLRAVVAADAFFVAYLASVVALAIRARPDDIRRRASFEDAGIVLIALLTISIVGSSFVAIFGIVNRAAAPAPLELGLAIASVPLGWMMLHAVAALRYAHLYYARAGASGDGKRRDAGGLAFPGVEEPSLWDFFYFAFVIGMTGQVSDVQVLTSGLRRAVLVQGITSFFFNTVILALAVNVAAGVVR